MNSLALMQTFQIKTGMDFWWTKDGSNL